MNKLTERIKGVNLGNWLVLERWMNPAMFRGTEALDEYHLPRMMKPELYEERIKTHRIEYICERDFSRIASWGFNLVRIPVPFFIFGDVEPFIGCVEELDKAFNWAEAYGLKILIDLHTAPGCQNAFDNGGMQNILTFTQNENDVPFVYSVLKRLAERYSERKALWGIQILNEPVVEEMYEKMHLAERTETNDPELRAKSKPLTLEFLKKFYTEAYDIMRPILKDDQYIVFHDAFLMTAWKDFMRDERFFNVVLDTHQYLMMLDWAGQADKNVYDEFLENVGKDIEEMEQYFPVVCGEWCVNNKVAADIADKDEQAEYYRYICDKQLEQWNKGSGYIYWSYKTLFDTVNSGLAHTNAWDLGRTMDMGWFTDK